MALKLHSTHAHFPTTRVEGKLQQECKQQHKHRQ